MFVWLGSASPRAHVHCSLTTIKKDLMTGGTSQLRLSRHYPCVFGQESNLVGDILTLMLAVVFSSTICQSP